MNIYLAGPMRGIPYFNKPAFDYAAASLRAYDFVVFNPAERDQDVYGPDVFVASGDHREVEHLGCTIADCMLADTHWICTQADVIALLPGWEKSKGAVAERALGECLGLTIMVLGKEFVRE